MTSFMNKGILQTVATRARLAWTIVAVAAVGLFVSSCDVHRLNNPGTAASITISPNTKTLVVSGSQQFTAVISDFSGAVITATPVWSVVAGGGSITADGLFTAGTSPQTFTNTVQATSGGMTATATIVVIPGPLATIFVAPNPTTLPTGVSQQFTAVGVDVAGNVVPMTPVWSIAAGGGTVGVTGIFTAGTTVGAFPNTVKASSGAISGTATVNVTAGALATITVSPNPQSLAIGATQQYTAVAMDAGGNVIPVTPNWAIVAGGGTIGATTGLFTAGGTAGTFSNTVQASVGSVAGFATVTVTTGALATITVTPNPVTVQSNGTQQFVANGKDGGGNAFAITPVWSVTAGGGTIDPNTGVFTAGLVAGTFNNTVRATSGAVFGTATVTVTTVGPVLATITVTPNPATVTTNSSQQFAAVGRDAAGVIVPIAPVWSVVNGGGSINSATGLFTAGPFTGTFTNTVRATSGAISGSATVIVQAPPVILPPPPIADLKTAALNGIMAGTAFTCVIGGVINADIAISPGNTVTGFPPCVITGQQHLGDAVAAQNQLDLTGAYNTLAGLPCSPANTVGTTNLGGTTKTAGVYCSATSLGVTGTLTLDGGGDPNANFVFQAGTGLTTAGNVVLINGAQAKNVWWQVGSSATIGTASQWKGNIVALTSITLVDNATLLGRALARNGAVSLGTNNVIILP